MFTHIFTLISVLFGACRPLLRSVRRAALGSLTLIAALRLLRGFAAPVASLTLCLVLILLPMLGSGQTFIKRFNIEGVNSLFNTISYDGDSIIIMGLMIDTTEFNSIASVFAKADEFGEIASYKKYRPYPYKQYYVPGNQPALLQIDTFYISHGYAAYEDKVDALLVKYNHHGDTLSVWRLADGVEELKSQCVIKIAAGGYIIGGVTLDNSDSFMIKLDENGQIMWEKIIYKSKYQGFKSLFQNQEIITACGYNENYTSPEARSTFQNEIYQFDLEGNEISYWIDPDTNTSTPSFIRTSDGGYISTGLRINNRVYPNTLYYQGCIIKWDSSFNKVWERSYGTENGMSYLFDIEENDDGTFVACGNGGNGGGWPDIMIGTGWLMKIAANGDEIWSRQFMGVDTMIYGKWYENQLYDLAILPDGDIVAVGYATGPGAT